jgi:transcription antitermination protein NusB
LRPHTNSPAELDGALGGKPSLQKLAQRIFAASPSSQKPKNAMPEQQEQSPQTNAEVKAKPKSARRRSRELALQGLYEFYVAKHDPVSIRLRVEGEEDFKRADKDFFREMWRGLSDDWEALIEISQPHLDRKFDEVSPIERGIVLIGAWELKHRVDIPYRVVINESVELAKSFGGTDGHKWVNGVLDKLAPSLRAEEIASRQR